MMTSPKYCGLRVPAQRLVSCITSEFNVRVRGLRFVAIATTRVYVCACRYGLIGAQTIHGHWLSCLWLDMYWVLEIGMIFYFNSSNI